jgi:hypothetical protein
MAREPREFGVPSFELSPSEEPMGFRQSGLYDARLPNIVRQQQRSIAVEAAKQRVKQEAREAVAVNAEWDKNLPVGPAVKPQHDTLRGYKRILKQGGGVRDVMFSASSYRIFDGIIAKRGGVDPDSRKYLNPAFNAEHPEYDNYSALRRNIAILRNYLLVTMLPDGNKESPNYVALQQMAEKLGDALAEKPGFLARWSHSVKRLFKGGDLATPETNPFREAANVPDKGIATMYDYLFDRRDTPVSLFPNPVAYATSKPWDLQAREQTPFSDENLLLYGRATVMEGIANAFEEVVKQIDTLQKNGNAVDTMTESDKKISVEHAHTILEKLRILIGSRQEETNVDVIEDSKRAEAELLLRATMAYSDSIHELARVDPNLLRDPTLQDTHDALGQIDYLMKVEAAEALREEGRTDAAQAMAKRASSMAPRRTQPIGSLVSRVSRGYSQSSSLSSSAGSKGSRSSSRSSQSSSPQSSRNAAARQAVQATTTTFAPGGRVKQVSNPSLMLFAQHINEHAHDYEHGHEHDHDPHAPDHTPPGKPSLGIGRK